MTYAILSLNIKGGTGKSTVTEELAYGLRDRGYDVGVLDADIDSANLASRLGAEGKVGYEGDHIITPVEHDDMLVYSMENAFEDSSFSQSGEFMGNVVQDMVENSAWGDLDYMVVDCPPGSSDVFNQLVRSLRPNLLGAVSVGVPKEVDDTARLVKVCNHNWVRVLGFIENMSGVYCHGDMVTCREGSDSFSSDDNKHIVAPFGRGGIRQFAEELGGEFLGEIPLCGEGATISEAASDTIDNTVDVIEDAEQPPLPEDNTGKASFIKNMWKTIIHGIRNLNDEIDIEGIQDKYGVEGRDPLIIEIEITDAGPITGLFSELIITLDDGNLSVLKSKKARRKGIEPEGGLKIESQDLHDSVKGEKKVLNSVTGEVMVEPYSITDAIQLGDAEMWGEKTTNRLSVLDRVFDEHISMTEVQKIMQEG